MSRPRVYQRIASELRERVLDGSYPAGSRMPSLRQVQEEFNVSQAIARAAYQVLIREGLVEGHFGGGYYVREQPARYRITRTRLVYRDEIGYFFDRAAQQWRAVQRPTISRQPASADVARLLAVNPGTDIVTRDRILGDPETGRAFQLATSYLLPDAVAALPVIAQPDTGPGGIYDRLEEKYGPLVWSEVIGACAPSSAEADLLLLPPGTPLLRILRTAGTSAGVVVEVNDTRMSAELFEIGPYAIERHASAHVDNM